MGNWGNGRHIWKKTAGGVGFLFLMLATSGFTQHGMKPYPVGEKPDPRLVLLKRTFGEFFVLCSSAFVAPAGLDQKDRYLFTAGHCAAEKSEGEFSVWTNFIRTAAIKSEHSMEAPVARGEFQHFGEADVAATPVTSAQIGDATPLVLASQLPKRGSKISVLSFLAGGRGGYGPYSLECTLQNKSVFIGNIGKDDGRTYGRIAYPAVCPYIVSPDGISGSPVVDEDGAMIGVVHSVMSSGNGFLSPQTVVLAGTRTKSILYFTPVLAKSYLCGKFDLEPRDGTFSEKNADGSTLEYSIAEGKLDGLLRIEVPDARVEIGFRAGALHGPRLVIGQGEILQHLRYEDGREVEDLRKGH